jgi:hypothetical protein
MPTKFHIIHGALFAALACSTVVHYRQRTKFNLLLTYNVELYENLRLSAHQVTYLCHILEENNISMTEFDQFALNHPTH